MKKSKKLLHELLDLLLDKEPETPVVMEVSALNCTAEVWFYDVHPDGEIKTKASYHRMGDRWEKWDENCHVTDVSDADVLEALRNA